jgi:hypothetical protein
MPQYGGKDVIEMTDAELIKASFAFEKMLQRALEKRQHPKYKEKFKNQPPQTINSSFLDLKNEIKAEIDKRQKEKENANT